MPTCVRCASEIAIATIDLPPPGLLAEVECKTCGPVLVDATGTPYTPNRKEAPMFPPNYNQIPMPSNGGARVMTQQPETFSGMPSAAAAEAARQQQVAAEAQARDSEKRFMALLQQTVDNRLQGLGTFLEQAKERIESLERGLGELMAYVQTLPAASAAAPLAPAEQRVLILLQNGLLTPTEAREALGLAGSAPDLAAPKASTRVTPAPFGEKRKPGRPRKAVETPPVEADVLRELSDIE